MVGYEETAGFSRFFRAATGMTATEFRRSGTAGR
jgi:AraC-like DNA-binding protein